MLRWYRASLFLATGSALLLTSSNIASIRQTNPIPGQIRLQVVVTDKAGQPVVNLTRDDFTVVEGKTPQQIVEFTKAEVPLSFGLILDTTGTMKRHLGELVVTAKGIINQMKPGDEAFLARIHDDQNMLIVDFTSDQLQLTEALSTIREGKGMAFVLDAVTEYSKKLIDRSSITPGEPRRTALILLTDGMDLDARLDLGPVLKRLKENRVQLFPVAFPVVIGEDDEPLINQRTKRAESFLKRMARDTDGLAILPHRIAPVKAVSDILSFQRVQYLLTCHCRSSSAPGGDGPKVGLIRGQGRDKYSIVSRPSAP